MHSARRRTLLWQVAGGVVSLFVIAASLGELLWVSLYVSDHTNVNLQWTVAVHALTAVAILLLALYLRGRHERNRAFAAAPPLDAEDARTSIRVGPVTIQLQWLFLLLPFFLGPQRESAAGVIGFCFLVFAAVLIHEAGHAIAALRFRQKHVAIHLHMLGGTTTSMGFMTRSQRLLMAAAGPAAGAIAGVLVIIAGVVVPSFRGSDSYHDLCFVTLGWSALNLFPLLPLDGGVIALDRLPQGTALPLSITVAAALAVITYVMGQSSLVLFFSIIALNNVMNLPGVASFLGTIGRRWD